MTPPEQPGLLRSAWLLPGLGVIAILGLFLPFLQGFLLIALGLSVMSLVSPRVARWVQRFRERGRDMWQKLKGGDS